MAIFGEEIGSLEQFIPIGFTLEKIRGIRLLGTYLVYVRFFFALLWPLSTILPSQQTQFGGKLASLCDCMNSVTQIKIFLFQMAVPSDKTKHF